jgi:hypothetical protein
MIVDNKEIEIAGKFIKIAELKKEWDEDVEDPEAFIKMLKSSGVKADIFTYMQQLPESRPKYKYDMEWDSIAAIPITSYENWLKKQVVQNSRKKIGLAQRKGVVIKLIEFNDQLVKGILDIYHEMPIIQGKPNRQYKTDFATAKKLNATFLDRAQFIGAFYNDELIAYIKLVTAGKFMRTMGILAKLAHREKGAMNLLIAKAVEICVEKKMPYLIYARFNYGKSGSETLKEFKRNLGFESIILPRYYIPLSTWGKIVLKLKLHREIVEYLPEKVIRKLLQMRSDWYTRKYAKQLPNENAHASTN